MAGRARQAIAIEQAVDWRIRIHGSAEYRDRVVATIAMPGKFDPLGAQQDVHACPVERRAERVGVQGLSPLVVGLLVTMPTVLRIQEGTRLQKIASYRSSIARHGYLPLAESEVIDFPHIVGVSLAKIFLIRAGILLGSLRATQGYE